MIHKIAHTSSLYFRDELQVLDTEYANGQLVEDDYIEKLDRLFKSEFSQDELCTLLKLYPHGIEDSTKGTIDRADIHSVNTAETGDHSFKLKFKVNFFYACDNIKVDTSENMTITLVWDASDERYYLCGEERPERFDEL